MKQQGEAAAQPTVSDGEMLEAAVSMAVVMVLPDGDLFVAQSFDPDIASQGQTVQEALRNLADALDFAACDSDAP